METKKNNKLIPFILLPFLFAVSFMFLISQTGNAAEFELIFSNDIRGEIEPCG